MPDDRLRLDRFIPYRLSIASNLVSDAIARIYQSLFGLSIPEWRVIAVVAETDALTQQRIGQRTRMDKVTVSRAAIGLERRGLIERRVNPQDGRAQQLHLSRSGQDLYANVAPKAKELERKLFAEFTAEEIAALMALLRKVEEAALSLTDDIPADATTPRI
jgi:DNA-binding MarR family transcriptional regulator